VRCKTSRIVEASPPPRRQKAPALGFLPRPNQRRLDPRPFCLGPISGAWILAPFASAQSAALGSLPRLPRPNQRRLDPCPFCLALISGAWILAPVCLGPISGAWFFVPFASAQSAALGSVPRLPRLNQRRLVSRLFFLGPISGAWIRASFASSSLRGAAPVAVLVRVRRRDYLYSYGKCHRLRDSRREQRRRPPV